MKFYPIDLVLGSMLPMLVEGIRLLHKKTFHPQGDITKQDSDTHYFSLALFLTASFTILFATKFDLSLSSCLFITGISLGVWMAYVYSCFQNHLTKQTADNLKRSFGSLLMIFLLGVVHIACPTLFMSMLSGIILGITSHVIAIYLQLCREEDARQDHALAAQHQ